MFDKNYTKRIITRVLNEIQELFGRDRAENPTEFYPNRYEFRERRETSAQSLPRNRRKLSRNYAARRSTVIDSSRINLIQLRRYIPFAVLNIHFTSGRPADHCNLIWFGLNLLIPTSVAARAPNLNADKIRKGNAVSQFGLFVNLRTCSGASEEGVRRSILHSYFRRRTHVHFRRHLVEIFNLELHGKRCRSLQVSCERGKCIKGREGAFDRNRHV